MASQLPFTARRMASAELAIFSRDVEGRFPESKELKQRIRDRIAPGKDLGHSEE